ncbi:hypothetical protein H5410_021117 [Solanum commersonii]|uniref:SWIM-type domain-containing protein n=1 Tax=Solanum commersonii TaxID=4109 RepID=A0A9J5ZE91_SOLCO|nr:hypothetical protein H5410_021117 [Solanum commersonii]
MVDELGGPIGLLEYTPTNEESFGAFNKEGDRGDHEGERVGYINENENEFEAATTQPVASQSSPVGNPKAVAPTQASTTTTITVEPETGAPTQPTFNPTVDLLKYKLKAERRSYQWRKRTERAPKDPEEVPVAKVGLDVGFDETEPVDKNLKGKVVGDEHVYCSSDAYRVETNSNTETMRDSRRIDFDKTAKKVMWQLGMVFESVNDFRDVVTKYSLQKGVQLEKFTNHPKKGLTSTIKHLSLEVEHRMCARHILVNWEQDYRGLERSNQFWKCARSTFEAELKANLAHMALLAPRHKTIITMLEEIRVKVINRLGQFLKFPETWLTNISPMVLRVLEKNIAKSMKCQIEFNGERGFEISDGSYVRTVDMSSRTCSCKSWMLKGIPCPYVIATILYKNWEPIDYVDDCYSKETYLRTYCHYLQLVTNMKMWSDSTNPHVEPPVVKSMLRRPRKDFVAARPCNEACTSRAIPKPRERPRKTPTTTTEAPVTDGEPPRPKGRPRKTPTITTEEPVSDGEPPRPKGRPRKTTNNEALIATLTIGRGMTIESLHFQILFYKLIFTPVTTSERDTTPDTSPARGRGICIGRADTTPGRGRGIDIERADTTPARGRGIGI